ncbi:hypothetical protein AB0G74_29900 [Streptomyces sp. NPDC020875]|uniref:hypothetical protein n=1 Tax=Streptomyces sp. NPDC020875 TaxID=3154898 RepID=UPI003401B731
MPLPAGRFVWPLTLATVLVAGCSGTAKSPGGTRERSASRSGEADRTGAGGRTGTGAAAGAAETFRPDAARLPETRAAARDLISRVIAGPDSFGAPVVRRSPYESDPATWPVLGEKCDWRQRRPADSVLATLTRSFEVPAERGKGPLRLTAVVTVHRSDQDAAWEMAESIEESMRCPTQRLRAGETISSLVSAALLRGEMDQTNSDDALTETGRYHSSELGGPHYYSWHQGRVLRFTFAVSGKGAKGRTDREVDQLTVQAYSTMLVRLGSAVGKRG